MATEALAVRDRPASTQALSFTKRQRQVAVLVVALAFVMDLMDSTILTIALPTIQRSMHASSTAVNWMAAGYSLTFALLLITGGRLGDVFGYRRLFVTGVAAFMVSSLAVGLAWSPAVVVSARLAQGLAAALMVPQVLSFVQLLYKPDERVRVNGAFGGLAMLATTFAPIVTALLIKANFGGLSWRPSFLINVPICIAAIPLATRYLPSGKSERRLRLDIFGTFLVTAAIGCLVFPLIEGRELGWPVWTYAAMVASAPLLGIFAWWQIRTDRNGGSPLVIPALFRHRSFSVGLGISLLIYAAVMGFALTFTLLLQLGHGFSAIQAVLTGLFITLGLLVTAGAMSKTLIPRLGRTALTIGTGSMAAGTAAVGLIASHAAAGLSSWELGPALLLIGAGMGMVVVPLTPFILSSVDPSDAGSASGTSNAVQQVGGALGIAFIGAAYFHQLALGSGYGGAFLFGALIQIGLLVLATALTFLLPLRIASEAYSQP